MPQKTGPGNAGQTLTRAINILRAVASSQGSAWRLTDIARAAGLDKSTAHRMINYLVDNGMLVKIKQSHAYRLGPLLFELGLCALPSNNLADLCAHTLARLAFLTQDTAFLLQRSGWDAICVNRAEGSYPVKTLTSGVGDRYPLGVGAGGMAILAALDDQAINMVLQAISCRLPAYGLDPDQLLAAIEQTRQQGYACDREVAAKDVVALGVALRGPSRQVVGSLFVATIPQRMNEVRIGELSALLCAAAQELDQLLADKLVLAA